MKEKKKGRFHSIPDSQAVRIYRYGAKPPVEIAAAMDQLYGAHALRNELCAIERRRREAGAAMLLQKFPDLEVLRAAAEQASSDVDAAEAEIKSARKKERKMVVATSEQKARLRDMRARRKSAWSAYKARRKEAWSDQSAKSALEAIDASAAVEIKAACAAARCSSGTKDMVNQACREFRKGPPPKFRRFDGGGRIAVRFRDGVGLGVQAFMRGENDWLWCDPSDPADKGTPGCNWRRVRIRCDIPTGIGRKAPQIYLETRVRFHRPLPVGGYIKGAWLLCRRIGPRREWELQLTVQAPGESFAKPCAIAGRVGVDVGWRLVPAGLRVAYIAGTDGDEREIILPHDRIRSWSKCEDLRSIRDREFNVVRDAVAAFVDSAAALPDWWAERFEHMAQWRSPARMASAVMFWREHRFAGDESIFERMNTWRLHNLHLYEWETSNMRKAIRWRRWFFRNFVAEMRRKYSVAMIESMNITDLQAAPRVEDETGEDRSMLKYARIAAVGELLAAIKQGMSTQPVPAENTTARCSRCHQKMEHQRPSDLIHTCAHCGLAIDQDLNAARNLRDHQAGQEEAA